MYEKNLLQQEFYKIWEGASFGKPRIERTVKDNESKGNNVTSFLGVRSVSKSRGGQGGFYLKERINREERIKNSKIL